MSEPQQPDPEKTLSEIFDLDRKGVVSKLVGDMEAAIHDQILAREGMKMVIAEAKDHQFRPREIEAMKTIAKLRVDDQLERAREKLEALERVSGMVGVDLFSWQYGREPGE